MQNLLEELKNVLSADERLVVDGQLVKNKIVEVGLKLDADLLELLLSNEQLKNHFFRLVNNTYVFDKQKFQRFVSNKQFLPDSYTAFKNKIGLTAGNEYIAVDKEVVLSWPYKDCVLEGGQTKEDSKRNEIFWNETLAPDQIDRLLDPKAMTTFKKYDEDGEDISIDNNLIVKGNNLLALHSLKKIYEGRVKLIYIDPPYNTGKDGFNYNDRFNHSAWLTFIQNRLQVAKKLLKNDGVLFVQITDEEQAYLKVLMDEIFGRENFIECIIWKKRNGPPNDKKIGSVHEYILAYAKDIDRVELFRKPRSEKQLARYDNPDNHPKGPWTPGDLMANVKGGRYVESLYYPIINPNTKEEHYPSSGGNWRYNKDDMNKLIENDEIYWGKDGKGRPKLKRFLQNVQDGVPFSTLWNDSFYSHTGTNELRELFDGKTVFDTTKPEELIRRIIILGSKEDDLIFDFFAGSGTTGAVAHKMGRQYILCEQMEYIESVTLKRLQKVIEGEQGGISKDVHWQGGGSFTYLELMQYNEQFVTQIENAESAEELQEVWVKMKQHAFLSYELNPLDIDENVEDFEALLLEDQKRFLIEILDKNQLYVNYSEIENGDYEISDSDKKLNHQFYNLK